MLNVWCQDPATSHIWNSTMEVSAFDFDHNKMILYVSI